MAVSSGSAARTPLSALCISEGVPSKNLPQPKKGNQNKIALDLVHAQLLLLTANKQGIPREDNPTVAILQKPADTILGVARRVKARGGDVTNLELLVVTRRQRHAFAIPSSPDWKIGLAESLTLEVGKNSDTSVSRGTVFMRTGENF